MFPAVAAVRVSSLNTPTCPLVRSSKDPLVGSVLPTGITNRVLKEKSAIFVCFYNLLFVSCHFNLGILHSSFVFCIHAEVLVNQIEELVFKVVFKFTILSD